MTQNKEPWSIRRLVTWATEDFRNRGFDSPRLDAELLLGKALNKTRIEIILEGDRPLDQSELDGFRDLVRRRRSGEPTAYILGSREFYGTLLEVNTNVLVPRPDTECLVEVALQRAQGHALEGPASICVQNAPDGEGSAELVSANGSGEECGHNKSGVSHGTRPASVMASDDAPLDGGMALTTDRELGEPPVDNAGAEVGTEIAIEGPPEFLGKSPQELAAQTTGNALDLCTGSGCVGIAFALARRQWTVTCVDLSPAALEVAQRNAQRAGLTSGISFVVGDLFAPLPAGAKYDIITANPPYIPTDVIPTLDVGIRNFEPWLALDGGPDGLDITRRLIETAPEWLHDNGILAIEIGYDQGPKVVDLMQKAGLVEIRVNKDYGGHHRVVSGRRA